MTFALPGRGEDLGATGDLDVREDAVIDLDCERLDPGVVAPFQVDAAGLDRVLHVASGVTVQLSALVMTGGQTDPGENGGAILNEGTLVVLDGFTRASGSTAGGDGGGLYNAGSANLQGAIITGDAAPSGRGGGIFNQGVLTLDGVDLNHDAALEGGGLFNAGTATARRSEISENDATTGSGGGVLNDLGATLHLGNLTVAENTAATGGAGVDNRGNADLSSVTLNAQLPVGLHNDDGSGASTSIKNTLLGDACSGSVISTGYNLTSSCVLGGVSTGNLIGVDPGLSGRVNCNVVSQCPHYRPLPGSAAIDAGDPAGCTDSNGSPFGLDQRGVLRQTGAACDIGAIESARPCEGGRPFEQAKLVIGGLGQGPGHQSIHFAGATTLSPSFELRPNFRGLQLAAADLGTGATLVNRSQEVDNPLRAGGFLRGSCREWRHTKTTYRYREISKGCSAAPLEGGVVKALQLRDDRQVPDADVKLKYKVAGLTIADPSAQIQTSFTFSASPYVSSAGYCGTHTFSATECRRKGTTFICEKG